MPTPELVLDLGEADAVGPGHVLGISTSMKPAPGHSTPSASRNLLLHAAGTVRRTYSMVRVFDLRATPLPFFDGRRPSAVDDPCLELCHRTVSRAGALCFSIPAYWGAVSGCFKNLIEVLSGPAYDLENGETPFCDKPSGVLVVGADDESAAVAEEQACRILRAVGANVATEPIVLGNPANLSAEQLTEATNALTGTIAGLAHHLAVRGRSG